MAKIVEKSAQIESAPETVWGLLINVSSWKTWWPDCIDAKTADGRTLREGSNIELVLQPRHSKLTFRPTVDMMTEGRKLSLTYLSPLMKATVTWEVAEGPTGARILVRGVFKGFQVWLMGVLGTNHVFQTTINGNARGLKKMAEKMV